MVKKRYIKPGKVFSFETPYTWLPRRLIMILKDFAECEQPFENSVVLIPNLDLDTGEVKLTRFIIRDDHVLCLFRAKKEKV
jgi:hypothetical protein